MESEHTEEFYNFSNIELVGKEQSNNSDKNGELNINNLVENNTLICLFLSAKWCNPCKRFLQILLDCYKCWKESNNKFEIIFCSSDTNESEFNEYFSTMPWYANKYDNKKIIEELRKKYTLKGMPSFLVFNNKGKLIDKEGQEKMIVYKEKSIENWLLSIK